MSYRPNRTEAMPPVVKNLLIINALVFIATIVLADHNQFITDTFALHHWSAKQFKIWQPLTHLFMHGGNVKNVEESFMHLFSNMFALWMFGSLLENYMGSKRFLMFYISCGLGAAFIYMAVLGYDFHCLKQALLAFDNNPTFNEFTRFLSQNHPSPYGPDDSLYALKNAWEANPMDTSFSSVAMAQLDGYYDFMISQPCVGASGAVFGLLFAFGYLFPNSIIYVFFSIPMKAKYFVALYAAFELYAGFRNSAGDNIAHTAHIGGMIIAFFILRLWHKTIKRNFF